MSGNELACSLGSSSAKIAWVLLNTKNALKNAGEITRAEYCPVCTGLLDVDFFFYLSRMVLLGDSYKCKSMAASFFYEKKSGSDYIMRSYEAKLSVCVRNGLLLPVNQSLMQTGECGNVFPCTVLLYHLLVHLLNQRNDKVYTYY